MGFATHLARFFRAKKGLAAVEFALIAPMMITLLFGSIEVIDALGTNRRAQNVASSIADVTSRDTEISNAELTGLWTAANLLMFPDDGSTIQVRISCISINSATDARVVWSEGHNGYAARAANSTVPLPSAMMTVGSSIIMAETIYEYHPPLRFLFGNNVNMDNVSYRRSRLVDPIPRV